MTLALTLMPLMLTLSLTLIFQLTYLKYCPYYPGLVEWCHRTIEDVTRKVMSEQTDWLKLLNSRFYFQLDPKSIVQLGSVP